MITRGEQPVARNAEHPSAAARGVRGAVGSLLTDLDSNENAMRPSGPVRVLPEGESTEPVRRAAEFVLQELTQGSRSRLYLETRLREKFPALKMTTIERRVRLAVAHLRSLGVPIVLRKGGGYRLMSSGRDLEAWRKTERKRALRILWTIARVTGDNVDDIIWQMRLEM